MTFLRYYQIAAVKLKVFYTQNLLVTRKNLYVAWYMPPLKLLPERDYNTDNENFLFSPRQLTCRTHESFFMLTHCAAIISCYLVTTLDINASMENVYGEI